MSGRHLRSDKLLLAAILLGALIAGVYTHRVSHRFENAMHEQLNNDTQTISQLAGSLKSLEEDIRAHNFHKNDLQIELIKASFRKVENLVAKVSAPHQFDSEHTSTRALQLTIPMVQDLNVWLDEGLPGMPPHSQSLLQIAAQRVYITRINLESIYRDATALTQNLIQEQSRQLKKFGNSMILMLGSLLGLMVLAAMLYNRHRQAVADLWQQRKLVSDSINKINEGFILTDENGKARVINIAMVRMCPELEKLLSQGEYYEHAISKAIGDGVLTPAGHSNLIQQDATLPSFTGQNVFTTNQGFYLRVSQRPTGDGGEVITFTDITDLKNTEDKLHYQANFDYLTGIANRSHFVNHLQTSLARARRHGHKVALMQFDLDRFKQVNDTLGHAAGDELLCHTANKIRQNLREIDLAARTGGDEFAAILDQIHDQEEVVATADRIVAALREKLEIEGAVLDFSASIGIAIFPEHANDLDVLMKHADIACYRAKSNGRDNYQMFGEDMKIQALEMQTMETRLREAIDKNLLFLDYQPHMMLSTGDLTTVEAFSRWQDNTLGLVSPDKFIPLADRNGLIARLGEQVLEKVFIQIQTWKQQSLSNMQVAINLSKRQLLQPNLPQIIDHLSNKYNVNPGHLMFEITESVISEGGEAATDRLIVLAERNITFVLDDYGRGTSSLHRIVTLPIRSLKIDGEFISRLTIDPAARDIVRAMISSARDLQLDTIAECVETEEQARILQELGCTSVQGYWVGPPQTPAQITEAYLDNRHGKSRKTG